MGDPAARRRRTFAPVVAAGLAAAALAAVASARPWVVGFDAAPGGHPLPDTSEAGEMPLASALSLVVLACWGVLLVTRGVVRRAVAVLALVAAAALAVTVVVGFTSLQDAVLTEMREAGATSDTLGTDITGWYWTAAVATVAALVTSALAVAWCPAWPEMGSRYDAPGAADRDEAPAEEQSNLELWRSMDEGRDPTA